MAEGAGASEPLVIVKEHVVSSGVSSLAPRRSPTAASLAPRRSPCTSGEGPMESPKEFDFTIEQAAIACKLSAFFFLCYCFKASINETKLSSEDR